MPAHYPVHMESAICQTIDERRGYRWHMLDKDLCEIVDGKDPGSDGRILVVRKDVPKLRAYTRNRRFAYTASTITLPELIQGMLPDRKYRRGDGEGDVIPSGWDGITFDASFGLGGNDMKFMRDVILVMGTGTSIIVPSDAEAMPMARKYAASVLSTSVSRRADEMDYPTEADGTRVTHDGVSPFLIASIDIPAGKSSVMLHGDYYDDGVLSHSWLVPSVSFELVVGVPSQHLCGIATNHPLGSESQASGQQWEYMMHCHVGRGKVNARYINMPTNTVLRGVCNGFRDNVLKLVDFIDYATRTSPC